MLFYLILYSIFLIYKIKSCPLTDEYLTRCHCGILTNGESYIKCDENSLNEIPKFKRSFPYDELILTNNNIQNLTLTSFDNIKTIRRINLYGNKLSFIDDNLLRLLGNYLEELILTGNQEINSLEFLTRYPLKKLRVLKLNGFNLKNLNLKTIFSNMTKLEILSLNSCQLNSFPSHSQIQILELENNFLSNTLFLSTINLKHINLAYNKLSTIILQTNENLLSLNLSHNQLIEYYSSTISNKNLQLLDLSYNQLTIIDWTTFNDNLTTLNLSSNYLTKISSKTFPKSLKNLYLNSNQIQTLENNTLFQQLTSLELNHNPFICNCHLKWLKNLIKKQFQSIPWKCSTSNFRCQIMPEIISFNITYITTSIYDHVIWIQWLINDKLNTILYLQISIEQPYRLSRKFYSNQTQAFIINNIQANQYYHICLLIIHKYARDKYCRNIITNNFKYQQIDFHDNEIVLSNSQQIETNDKNLYLLLIGSCIGGLLTLILLITCCYLCYQIHHYKTYNTKPIYEKCSQHYHYPIYHSHPISCQHQQQQQLPIYNSENISNSTDSTHMDTSLSTTINNSKHIYQTIDSQDYCSLQQRQQLFQLWNQSIKHKR